jgi:hypothetical protein
MLRSMQSGQRAREAFCGFSAHSQGSVCQISLH